MNHRNAIIGLCALSLALGRLCCTFDVAGGTETPNGYAFGKIIGADGRPADSAVVQLFECDNLPSSGPPKAAATGQSVFTTFTNRDGEFNISSDLAAGYYNIYGFKDENLCYAESIQITKGRLSDTDEHFTDTLLPAGSISGVVRLLPQHSSATALILVYGSNTFTYPADSIGNFTLSHMAAGVYRIRILSIIDIYIPMDTVFTIRSGKIDTLTDTLRLKYTGAPAVSGLSVVYDSLKLIARVWWNKIDTAIASKYMLNRSITGDGYPLWDKKVVVPDTLYSDDTLIQSISDLGQSLQYRVSAYDKDGIEGPYSKPSPAIRIRAAYKPVDSVLLCDQATIVFGISDLETDNAGYVYISVKKDNSFRILKYSPMLGFVDTITIGPFATKRFKVNDKGYIFAIDAAGVARRWTGAGQAADTADTLLDVHAESLNWSIADIAADQGQVYVLADRNNYNAATTPRNDTTRIYKFSEDGQLLQKWTYDNTSLWPVRMTAYSGWLFVSFKQALTGMPRDSIEVFDATMGLLTKSIRLSLNTTPVKPSGLLTIRNNAIYYERCEFAFDGTVISRFVPALPGCEYANDNENYAAWPANAAGDRYVALKKQGTVIYKLYRFSRR
jgi:hypothetical protein